MQTAGIVSREDMQSLYKVKSADITKPSSSSSSSLKTALLLERDLSMLGCLNDVLREQGVRKARNMLKHYIIIREQMYSSSSLLQ